jgi:hypothetical protein
MGVDENDDEYQFNMTIDPKAKKEFTWTIIARFHIFQTPLTRSSAALLIGRRGRWGQRFQVDRVRGEYSP